MSYNLNTPQGAIILALNENNRTLQLLHHTIKALTGYTSVTERDQILALLDDQIQNNMMLNNITISQLKEDDNDSQDVSINND